MGRRRLVTSFTSAELQQLGSEILDYVDESVRLEHEAAHTWHHVGNPAFFNGHRQFIAKLEDALAARGLSQFVPLPKWDPTTPVPAELRGVKMLPAVMNHVPSVGATIPNSNPNLPTPANLANLTQFSDASALSNDQALQAWHGNVHVTVGGAMAHLKISPCAAVFWTWHAFIDDIYEDWLDWIALRWSWLNMDKPQWANIRASMGAVTVMDTPTSPQRPHLFVEGYDYNLWCRWSDGGSQWSWLNMDKPQGVNISALVGVVTVMDTPTSPQRPHVFVTGNDGHLWCRWSDGGSQWSWLDMGRPPSANVRTPIGAVTVMDTPTSPQRPHVFVEGTDGNLWCHWSDGGSQWSWLNMGKPPSANIRTPMGAVTVMDTPTSPQRPHVFVEGNDGHLWCRWSDGGSQWSWLDMGKPQGADIRASMGAVTVMDTPTSPQRPHLFVEGNDYNLWCRWSDGGSQWSWLDMGKPQGVNITGLVGVVTVMDSPTAPQRPYVFVTGNDGHLWCRWSDGGSEWNWLNMGKPQWANIRAAMGVVTVMDTPASPQRPHLFVEGNDYNLWCDWSSR